MYVYKKRIIETLKNETKIWVGESVSPWRGEESQRKYVELIFLKWKETKNWENFSFLTNTLLCQRQLIQFSAKGQKSSIEFSVVL